MTMYQIVDARITYSIDKLDGTMPLPPGRVCPLAFEKELTETMALKARFEQLCDDLKAQQPINALDLNDAREQLKGLFTQLLVLEGAQQFALDGGSMPTYRPLPPPGGHWTEDYIQFIDNAGVRSPWSIDVPLAAPTHRAFPCLRVFLK